MPRSAPALNSLGLPVTHDDKAPDDAKLVYGINSAGEAVHVSEVMRGLACDCRCPSCQARLIAKQGTVRAHHFAHQAEDACLAAETQAHYFAKMVIAERMGLWLPASRRKASGYVEFDQVYIEHGLGEIRPDLYAAKSGRALLIEIAVTHRVPLEKVQKIRQLNVSCIEIDLSSYRHKRDRLIADGVFATAPRRWIHNAKYPVEVQRQGGQRKPVRDRSSQQNLDTGPPIPTPPYEPLSPITQADWESFRRRHPSTKRESNPSGEPRG